VAGGACADVVSRRGFFAVVASVGGDVSGAAVSGGAVVGGSVVVVEGASVVVVGATVVVVGGSVAGGAGSVNALTGDAMRAASVVVVVEASVLEEAEPCRSSTMTRTGAPSKDVRSIDRVFPLRDRFATVSQRSAR
jgi:hypothetical protein